MHQVGLLGVAQVGDEGAAGADGRRPGVETEALQPGHLQLVAQRLRAARGVERPTIHRRDGDGRFPDGGEGRRDVGAGGDDDLARREHRDLVVQRAPRLGAGVLRHLELAGRQVEQRHTEPLVLARRAIES